MAYSTQRAESDGTLAYLDVSIEYIKRADIGVFYDGLPAAPGTWAWVGTTDKRIAFTPNVPNGVEVLLKRTTQIDKIIHKFSGGAKFNNSTMDQDFTQLLYLNQEAVEGAALTDIFNDVDFHGYKIKNLGLAVDPTDAITYGQLLTMNDNAHDAEVNAAASAVLAQQWAMQTPVAVDGTNFSAKQYAQNASVFAANASGSASAAAGSASAAAGSASAANTSRTQAQAAQAAAESARDDAEAAAAPATEIFDRLDALDAAVPNKMDKAANLSDVASVTTSRTNLDVYSKAETQTLKRFHTGCDNLRGGTTGASTFGISADFVWLRNSAGDTVGVQGSSLSVNYAATGLGGRDQAGSFTGVWTYVYYVWGAGQPLGVVASSSPNGPSFSLLTGYSYFCRAANVRVSGTANVLVAIAIRGSYHYYAQGVAQVGGTGVGLAAASGVYPMTNLSVYVPPLAYSLDIKASAYGSAGAGGAIMRATWRDDSNGAQYRQFYDAAGSTGVGYARTWWIKAPVGTGNFSLLVGNDATWSSMTIDFAIEGFEFPNNSN